MMEDEEISNWNSTFSSTIQESDLKRPTELFMVRTLVAYLRKLGYKVEPPFLLNAESENTPQKLAFMIRLAQNIDRILKYNSENYSFVYIDLIHPLPKKTSKILSVLLNYYIYYVMFKKEVFDMANVPIKKRAELIRAIAEKRRSNEDRRQNVLQIKDGISKLAIALPNTQMEKEDALAKTKQHKKQYEKVKTEVEELEQKLLGLQTQELILQNQIVSENESSKLKSELVELKDSIKQHKLLKLNMESSLNERSELINHLQKQLKYVEEIKVVLPVELLREYKDILEKLRQTKSEHKNIIHEVEMLKNTITKLNEDIERESKKSKSKKRNYEQETRDHLTLLAEKQKLCIEKKDKLNSIKKELETTINLEQEQLEMRDFVAESTSQLLN